MKRSKRHVFLHGQTLMILFPIPDRMTNPDGCEASFEHFARDDLVGLKMDFKRPRQKN